MDDIINLYRSVQKGAYSSSEGTLTNWGENNLWWEEYQVVGN